MKKGIANFVYNFSEAQWSWIEQNMERLNISERMAARAGMFFAKSAQLDPDFWAEGWEKTRWDKLREAIDFLERTEWGKGSIGSEILKVLQYLFLTGRINLELGGTTPHIIAPSKEITIGSWWLENTVEAALALVHEGAHALSAFLENFESLRGKSDIGKDRDYTDYRLAQEGYAFAFERTLYLEVRNLLNFDSYFTFRHEAFTPPSFTTRVEWFILIGRWYMHF